jgi:ABC-type arginine/histidine transport system permease subunit
MITITAISSMITVFKVTKVIDVIEFLEITKEGYKDFSVHGLRNLVKILIAVIIKNIILPSESRAQRYAQVPPVAEHMSIQWLHKKYYSGAGI